MYLPSLLGFAAVLVGAVSANYGNIRRPGGFSGSWSSNNLGGSEGGQLRGPGPIGNIISRLRFISGRRPIRRWIFGNRGISGIGSGGRFSTFGGDGGRGNNLIGGNRDNGVWEGGDEQEGGGELSWSSTSGGQEGKGPFSNRDDEGYESGGNYEYERGNKYEWDEDEGDRTSNNFEDQENRDGPENQEDNGNDHDATDGDEDQSGLPAGRGGGRSASRTTGRQWNINFRGNDFEGNEYCPTCDGEQEEFCATCGEQQKQSDSMENVNRNTGRGNGRSGFQNTGSDNESGPSERTRIRQNNVGRLNIDGIVGGFLNRIRPGDIGDIRGRENQLVDRIRNRANNLGRLFEHIGNDDNKEPLIERIRNGGNNVRRVFERIRNGSQRSGNQPTSDDFVDQYEEDYGQNEDNKEPLLNRLKNGASNVGRLFERFRNSAQRSGNQPRNDNSVDQYEEEYGQDEDNKEPHLNRLKNGATNGGRLFERIRNGAQRSGSQPSDDESVDQYVEEYGQNEDNEDPLPNRLKNGASNGGRLFERFRNGAQRSGSQPREGNSVDQYEEAYGQDEDNKEPLVDRIRNGASNVGRLFERIRNGPGKENKEPLVDRIRNGASNVGRLFERIMNGSQRSGSQPSDDDSVDQHVEEYGQDEDNKEPVFDRLKSGASNVERLFERTRNGENNDNNEPLLNTLKNGASNVGRLFERIRNGSQRSGSQPSDDDSVDQHLGEYGQDEDNEEPLLNTIKNGASNVGRLFERIRNGAQRSGSQPSDDDSVDQHVEEHGQDEDNKEPLLNTIKNGASNVGRLFERIRNGPGKEIKEPLVDRLRNGASNVGRLFERIRNGAQRSVSQPSDDDSVGQHVEEGQDGHEEDNEIPLLDRIKTGATNELFERVRNGAQRSGIQGIQPDGNERNVDDNHTYGEEDEGDKLISEHYQNEGHDEIDNNGPDQSKRLVFKSLGNRIGGSQWNNSFNFDKLGRLITLVRNGSQGSGSIPEPENENHDENRESGYKTGDLTTGGRWIFKPISGGLGNGLFGRLLTQVKNGAQRSGSNSEPQNENHDENSENGDQNNNAINSLISKYKNGDSTSGGHWNSKPISGGLGNGLFGRLLTQVRNGAQRSGSSSEPQNENHDENSENGDQNNNAINGINSLISKYKTGDFTTGGRWNSKLNSGGQGNGLFGRLLTQVQNGAQRSGSISEPENENHDENSENGGQNNNIINGIGSLINKYKNSNFNIGGQSNSKLNNGRPGNDLLGTLLTQVRNGVQSIGNQNQRGSIFQQGAKRSKHICLHC